MSERGTLGGAVALLLVACILVGVPLDAGAIGGLTTVTWPGN